MIMLSAFRGLPRQLFAASVAISGLAACHGQSTPQTAGMVAPGVDQLKTAPVTEQERYRRVFFDGVVEAVSQATVSAQTSGRIIELPFDVGDSVQAGDEIVRITSSEQASRVDAAESALAAALAQRTEAERSFQRAEDVIARNVISKAEFDRIKAQRDAARANVDSARAALTQAREALKYTTVSAPYSGTVLERHVRVGEAVSPGAPLMTGVSLDSLRVVVNVPQTRMAAFAQSLSAQLILDDGRIISPARVRMPAAADAATHSFRVRLDIPADGPRVAPGTLLKVVFSHDPQPRLTVPASAIVRRGELSAVYVVEAEGVGFRYVRLGQSALVPSDDIVVESGLTAGEKVALVPEQAVAVYKDQQFVSKVAGRE